MWARLKRCHFFRVSQLEAGVLCYQRYTLVPAKKGPSRPAEKQQWGDTWWWWGGTVHEQLSPEGLQDGSPLCLCYSKLLAKSPVEGQASSVGVMSRKDVLVALAAPPLGHLA